jgi:hypothetical protein
MAFDVVPYGKMYLTELIARRYDIHSTAGVLWRKISVYYIPASIVSENEQDK